MSYCFKHAIRIYPTPYGNNYKITIEKQGKPKTGDKIFFLKTRIDPKTKEVISLGLYEKIWQLYEQIAINIMNSKKQMA